MEVISPHRSYPIFSSQSNFCLRWSHFTSWRTEGRGQGWGNGATKSIAGSRTWTVVNNLPFLSSWYHYIFSRGFSQVALFDICCDHRHSTSTVFPDTLESGVGRKFIEYIDCPPWELAALLYPSLGFILAAFSCRRVIHASRKMCSHPHACKM
jgi:hypothetical protein